MENRTKKAEELQEENIKSIVEQVEIWQKTDNLKRTAIIILNEDTSDGNTKSVNMVYGLRINLLLALQNFIKTDIGAILIKQLATMEVLIDGLPTICMKTADNKVLTGWLASQTDMLSEDWIILED